VPRYLALLDRHQVAWVERRDTDPGSIIYQDWAQVVAVPRLERAAAWSPPHR
jgi:hypothetical protein